MYTHLHSHRHTSSHTVIWASLQLWSCAKNFPRPKLFNYFLRCSRSLSWCSTRHHNQHQNHHRCNDATYSLKQSRVSDADVQKFTIWIQLNVILRLISVHVTPYFIHISLQNYIFKQAQIINVSDFLRGWHLVVIFAWLWTYKVTFC